MTDIDRAYRERNTIACALARSFLNAGGRAGVALDPQGEDGFRVVVVVMLPAGRVGWHMDERDPARPWADLPELPEPWESFTSEVNAARLQEFLHADPASQRKAHVVWRRGQMGLVSEGDAEPVAELSAASDPEPPALSVVGSEEAFDIRFEQGTEGECAVVAMIDLYGSGVAIRRRRADVKRDLPPVQEVWHVVDCDATPLREVEASAMQLAHAILNAQGEDRKKLRQMSSDFVGALRQATGLAKAPHVAAFVRMLVEQSGSVVLYGWHRSVYHVWEKALGDLGIAWYTGSESGAAKHKEAQRFKSGEAKVLIMSLRSGAGLDGLQSVCNTVVIGELDWSPQVHAQAIGRLARDGQTDPVFAYFLWADDGSDLTMRAVADDKHMQLVGVRDPLDSLVTETEVDPDHVKRLAEAYLGRHKRSSVVSAMKEEEP